MAGMHPKIVYGAAVVLGVVLPLTAWAALSQINHDDMGMRDIAPLVGYQHADASPEAALNVPVQVERTLRIGKGEVLPQTLRRAGMSSEVANAVVSSLAGKVDMRTLKAGTVLHLNYKEEMPYQVEHVALSFRYGPGQEARVTWENGKAVAKVIQHKLETVQSVAVGRIQSSLYEDATEAGLPAALVKPFVDLFAWDIDYTRDIHAGDTFKIVFEETLDDQGKRVKTGRILAASFTVRKQKATQQAFWFVDEHGRGDYYNDKGEGKRKLLLRTPLETYRISSHFNLNRKHPVLGFTRAHRGTDFAAPIGTPVKASGDGIVKEARVRGGYGNYLSIEHNPTYLTAYGHLHKFAKGIRPGVRVKQGQIVAYVGNTGVSTGPHLHYEVHVRGVQVDPMRTDLPTGTMMASKHKQRFLAMVDGIQTRWNKELTRLALAGKQDKEG